MLSRRGVAATAPSLPYLELFVAGLQRPYDASTRPDGVISMVIAENRLVAGAIEAALRRAAAEMPADRTIAGYDDMCGRHGLRSAMLDMVARTFLRGRVPRSALQERCLVASSGCGALIGHLAMVLGDPGQSVLLPTPTYASLYNDFQTLAGLVVVDVATAADDGYRLHVSSLEAARAAAVSAGHPPALLMLLHPSNPMGHTLSASEVLVAVDWCAAHGLHCVVDEVYANSVYDAEPAVASVWSAGGRGGPARKPRSLDELFGVGGGGRADADGVAAGAEVAPASSRFDSVVAVLHERGGGGGGGGGAGSSETALLPPHVHVLWGMSKDWGMSGVRVGCLYTCNEQLLQVRRWWRRRR